MTVIANLDNLVRSANFECNGEREITSADGSKCLKCFPYSRAQENNTVCKPDVCPGGISLFSGKCLPCEVGLIPDTLGR
jgi:hypothetical protein